MSLSLSLPLDGALSPHMSSALSVQLAAALAADAHSEQVNSAKLRSVDQQHDYEQFKGMVAGAHLQGVNFTQQPLDSIAAAQGKTAVREEGGAGAQTRGLEHAMGRVSLKEQRDNEARQRELLAETQRNVGAHKQPSTGQCASDSQPSIPPVAPSLTDRCVCLRCVQLTSSSGTGDGWVAWRSRRRRDTSQQRSTTACQTRTTDAAPATKLTLCSTLTLRIDVVHSYLLSLDAAGLPLLMKGGSGLEVLGELLDTLEAGRAERQQRDEAPPVFALLASLSTVDRFSMTVAFLSAAQKQRTSALLGWLRQRAPPTAGSAQQAAVVGEAKEQIAAQTSVNNAAAVSTSSTQSASSAAATRAQLPLQLPASSTASSYPMLIPGWSSFSSPPAGPSPARVVQRPAVKVSSSASARVAQLSFDAAGVGELRKRFKLPDE